MIAGIVIIVAVAAAAAGLAWWLVFETEGVYLGRRVVVWLYDVNANRYDRIKKLVPEYEQWLLARPLLHRIAPHRSPLVLDVATGTGRLPLALLQTDTFQGHVIGLDLSRKMLFKAAVKLGGDPRASLVWSPAVDLPFADDTFDVVTCLEALEFMDREAALGELIRVLRPGGLLLITNRMTKWMPGKTWTDDGLADLLFDGGMASVETELWQVDYTKVWATKAGEALPRGARPLEEILCCPHCGAKAITRDEGRLLCTACGTAIPTGEDGVIEVAG